MKLFKSAERFDHQSSNGSRLVESYCRQCGLIVAASKHLEILEMVEGMHQCPVYLNYAQKSSSGRPRPQVGRLK